MPYSTEYVLPNHSLFHLTGEYKNQVLNEHVHSYEIASCHLPSRGVLVFGMYIQYPNIRTARQFWHYFFPALVIYGSSSRRINVSDHTIVIDRISSIPELVHLVRHHESNRTTDQSWRCRWHFGVRRRAGRPHSMSCLGSGIGSTRSSNGKSLFYLNN